MKLKSVFNFSSLAALALAGGCARTTLPRPTAADATRAGTTLAELEHGRSLYLNHCAGCHQPVAPSAKPASEWPAHVTEMQERAHLDDREAAAVIRYLVTMAADRGSGS